MELAGRGEACSPTTRLNVMLPQLPDLGVWRVEAHGYYAAVELAAAGHVLDLAATTGRMIAARLRVEARQIKRPGQPRRDFVVPVLELPHTLGDVLAATGAAAVTGPVPAAALGRPAPGGELSAPPPMPPASPPPDAPPAPGPSGGAPTDGPSSAGGASADLEQLLAVVEEHLTAAGITGEQVGALARFYRVESLGQLRPAQLRTLAEKLTDPDEAARIAGVLATVCVSCGATREQLDDTGRCDDCGLPL